MSTVEVVGLVTALAKRSEFKGSDQHDRHEGRRQGCRRAREM